MYVSLTAAGIIYKNATYFLDFENLTSLVDPMSGRIAKANGKYSWVPSPMGGGIRLTDGWVDLGRFVDTCLYKPANCSTGVTVSFFLKWSLETFTNKDSLVIFGNRGFHDKIQGFAYVWDRQNYFRVGPYYEHANPCLRRVGGSFLNWRLLTLVWPSGNAEKTIKMYYGGHPINYPCDKQLLESLQLEDRYTLGSSVLPLTAYFDNVAVWNRPLSANEIKDIWNHVLGKCFWL